MSIFSEGIHEGRRFLPAAITAEIHGLTQKVAILEAENADLKRALGQSHDATRIDALRRKWRFTTREAEYVLTLYAAHPRVMTKGALMDALYLDRTNEPEIKIIDIWACKIRRKAGFLHTVWAQGYRLSDAALIQIGEAI